MYFFFTKKATNRDIIQKSILQNIISSSLYAANLTSISYQNHSDTVQSSTTFLKHDEKTLKHTFLTEPTKRNHIHRTSLNFDNLINPTWKSHRHNYNDIFYKNLTYYISMTHNSLTLNSFNIYRAASHPHTKPFDPITTPYLPATHVQL